MFFKIRGQPKQRSIVPKRKIEQAMPAVLIGVRSEVEETGFFSGGTLLKLVCLIGGLGEFEPKFASFLPAWCSDGTSVIPLHLGQTQRLPAFEMGDPSNLSQVGHLYLIILMSSKVYKSGSGITYWNLSCGRRPLDSFRVD